MRLALDTNRYTDLCRDTADVVALVEHRGAENERRLRQFPAHPGISGSRRLGG
jgi:hypothetical protein